MELVKKIGLISVFYLLFFFFMINRLFFFSQGIAEQTMSCLVYPFMKVRSVLVYPFSSIATHWQDAGSLQKEIEDLQLINHQLQEKLIFQESLNQYNQETKEIIEYAKRYEQDVKQLAKVLLTNISEKEDIIIIDAGTGQGVCKDDIVIYNNMLIGRVVELHPWYCKVALITDKRCKISAQTSPGVEGICSGKNNGQIELNFIPHFKEVAIGQMIISTGSGLVYPAGFALGEVVSVKTDNVCHFIEAKTLLDVSSLSYVYIFRRPVQKVEPDVVVV